MDWTDKINLGSADPRLIAGNLIGTFISYLGILVVLIVLWAGFKWMISGGKEEKVKDAKMTLVNMVFGLLVILSAYSIVNFVIKSISDANGVTPTNQPTNSPPENL